MQDLRVAAVCMHAIPQAIERNLDRMERLAREAAAHMADVICFPELAVTGYKAKPPVPALEGEDWEKAVARLSAIARDTGAVILAGLVEGAQGRSPYITQAVIAPAGILGLYRKTHLSPPEKTTYHPGAELPVFSFKNSSFGIQICYETHFPEISTALALQGAEILFMPHASPRGTPEEKRNSWMRHLQARAFDNGVFAVACNQVGKTVGGLSFPGVALILGPDGHVVAEYAGRQEQVLVADLKASHLQAIRSHRMRYFLPNRRPDLYKSLLRKPR
ncbi:Hydrolase, carbon-nitrogen family [uncultured Desulfatiglans sp.]|nr:Hydrolase, carbon-nitrogen family [uncultured Desulfatiglans sp.]